LKFSSRYIISCSIVLALSLLGYACTGPEHPPGKDPSMGTSEKSDSTVELFNENAPATGDTSVITQFATIRTTVGTFTIGLFGQETPKTVNNFLTLARRGKYNHVLVHRVARDFVIQTGDPKTRSPKKREEWGSGGESSYGKPFEDELNPESPAYRRGYIRGTVAMANNGPNTNTSQFFICLEDIPDLPKSFTIFGKVTDGLSVIDSIGAVPIEPVIDATDGIPIEPIMIKSMRISSHSNKK
jgi:cyclophilin family peptidyl-prolyl cis-trans isomerase